MLKNPNQKIIKRMAWNNLKRNARKTITLLFAVVLASFLIFTIFTVGNSYFKLQKIQNIRMSGAEFDAILYGVTDEQKQLCEENPNITLTGTAGSCGWVEKTDKDSTPNVGLIWADDAYWTQMMAPVREKLEGTYPTAFNEIMVTKKALKECGYETLKVGDTFSMSYGTYDGIQTGNFKISGIWDGYGPKKIFYVSKEFYDKSGWKLSQAASGRYFIDFKQKFMTTKEQNAFIESILHLSVSGKVRYYGLLQTVGMTQKQIKQMLQKQMLIIGFIGIIVGCLIGVFVSFSLIPIVVKSLGIKENYVDSSMVCFQPTVLLATILLVGFTIFSANRKPVKMATAVSPIEALGYRSASKLKKTKRAGKSKVINRLCLEQLVKDKKRTTVVLLSLAASLSVYLCIVTMLDSQAARTIVSNNMDMDIEIKNDTATKEHKKDRKDILDESIVTSIKDLDGVSEVHPVVFAEITVPWEPDFSDMWMKEFYEKWMTIPYSQEKEEYQNHPENFGSSLIGIDEQEFDRLNENLEQPINKEEFLSGKTCIIYRNGLDLSNSDLIGSKVTCALHSDKQVTQTFTIGGVTDESYYTAILGYPPTIITSDQVVKNFANESITLKIGVKYTKEYDRNIEKEILKLLEANGKEKDLSWDSKIEEADEIKNAQGYMPQIGMGIVLILAFIGIMNYINTFVANVQNRMTEFSIMESIGMTPRQLLLMLIKEGILYAGGAWMVTLTVGMGVTYVIYQSMNYRKVPFSIPLLAILVAAVVSFLVCIVVPAVTWLILEKNGSLVQRIKGIE